MSTVGARDPVLFIHGGPGQWSYTSFFDEVLADLATVHRYDQRGGGRSSRSSPFTVAKFVADIETLRRHFGYKRWTLIGHSWGATLALTYAWEHPERVEKLLYVSGVGLGNEWRAAYREEREKRLRPEENARLAELSDRERNAEEEIEFLTLAWARDYFDRDTGFHESRRLANEGFAINYACNRELGDEVKTWDEAELMGRCFAVEAPVLILHGAQDPRPFWATDSMLECLPSVDRVVFEDCGHSPWVEKRDDFTAVVREFIGSNNDA